VTKLAIVGSTTFQDPFGDMLAEWIIKRALVFFEPDVVISGAAPGVDTMAERMAMRLGFATCIYPPVNKRWKPRGFEARNLHIARACTHLVTIRCHASRTYGSGWTADRAEEFGKTVFRRII
jgi:hypothetical protein